MKQGLVAEGMSLRFYAGNLFIQTRLRGVLFCEADPPPNRQELHNLTVLLQELSCSRSELEFPFPHVEVVQERVDLSATNRV